MIRFRLHGSVPRNYTTDMVYGIVSRKSYFGFHTAVLRKDLDIACSKSTLLFFTKREGAEQVANFLTSHPNRLSDDGKVLRTGMRVSSGALRKPLKIEGLPLRDLEQLCLLRYIDAYIAFHTFEPESRQSDSKEDADLIVECYTFNSLELPNRTILVKMMEDMWRKNE